MKLLYDNGAIIVPVFNDFHNQLTIQKLSKLYPDYQVKTVYDCEILLSGDNIYCITQKIPDRHKWD